MFSELFSEDQIQQLKERAESSSEDELLRCLAQAKWGKEHMPLLLSPIAQNHLETLAQKSQAITKQRFGHTMKLFVPLYLSNECFNSCTYCGFSQELDYQRKTLNDEEILKEAMILKNKGFQHLVLLTGESPKNVGVEYIKNAIELIRPHFSSIGIEVQPLSTAEYQCLIEAGADSLIVYQETYHREQYAAVHLRGKKRLFDHRLNTADRGGEAGFYRINLGALLGLYDWRYEALALTEHIHYLQKKYWQSKIAVSFPRIKKMKGQFIPPYPVSDKELVQLIAAMRLVFPDLNISLSTREDESLRNALIHLGITDLSAESSTEPGGYSGMKEEGQFETSDQRNLDEVQNMLLEQGFDPMLKDWDKAYQR